MLRRVSGMLARFLGDRKANVATLVGISAIPLIGLTGFGIDYGYMLSLKAKLDQAADAAAVAGATTAANYLTSYSGTLDVWSQAQAAGQNQASAQFQANVGRLPTGTLSSITPDVQKKQTTITSTLKYSFTMKPFVMNVIGVPQMTVGGTSVSKQVLPTYVNIYVVLDNSESMGIGATASDQQLVGNVTGNCAVACHFPGSDTEKQVRTVYPKVNLRIDAAKAAINAGLKSIPSGGNYQVAVYTMNNTLTKVFPSGDSGKLSNVISDAITAVNSIDLANTDQTGGSNITSSLQSLATDANFKTAGDGTTPDKAQGIVMLITDAVQDSDMKYWTGYSYADKNDPNFAASSPCSPSVGPVNCWYSNTFKLYFQAFDPNQCDTIKNKSYTLMTLDVQYLIPELSLQGSKSQGFQDIFSTIQKNYLSPSDINNPIINNMKSCATTIGSTTYAYSANTPADITTAVTQMFGAIPAAAAARLYQ